MEGHTETVGYQEGLRKLENFNLKRQGVITRRPGTRVISATKLEHNDTVLIPFETGLSNSYMLEVGNEYIRFYKDKGRIDTFPGGPAVELETPYNDSNIRALHWTQSVDVLFLFHALFRQRRVNRLGDLQWTITDITHRPPPSYEKDTDISDSAAIGTIGGGQGINTPPEEQPNPGGGPGGDTGGSGTNGGDGGGGAGDGGDGGGGDGDGGGE